MADAVASQTLFDSNAAEGKAVLKFTNLSDGTGESAVKKVDIDTLNGAPTRCKIERIQFATVGMAVRLLWDATADVTIIDLPADAAGEFDFREFGGLRNNAGSGITGDIMLTTTGHSSGDAYTVILHLRKAAA